MKKLEINTFESIKHYDEEKNEYWSARELQLVLEYSKWQNFVKVINAAIEACINSDNNVSHHFTDVGKMVKTGVTIRNIKDYNLSRYACYLIAQNGDSRKKVIALAQTYFAVQTRKQELNDIDYGLMSEEEKRKITRKGGENV